VLAQAMELIAEGNERKVGSGQTDADPYEI